MIQVTNNAAGELLKILDANSELQGAYLRIKVVGGGCSGMRYAMDMTTEPIATTDKVDHVSGLQIVVDAKSALFLQGVVLDHTSGLNGKGFEFSNPNAKRSCGCGNSFSC